MTWKKLVITLIYEPKLNTSVNWASFDINSHLLLPLCVYQAIGQEKVYTRTVKIDRHKFCHFKYKICQNTKTLIFTQLKTKFGYSCIGFFPTRKLAIYKMTSVIKSYTSQSLLKNITLIICWQFSRQFY